MPLVVVGNFGPGTGQLDEWLRGHPADRRFWLADLRAGLRVGRLSAPASTNHLPVFDDQQMVLCPVSRYNVK
jgi:hypothetical protein